MGGEGGIQADSHLAWATSGKPLPSPGPGLRGLLCSPKAVWSGTHLLPCPHHLCGDYFCTHLLGFSKGGAVGQAAVSLVLTVALGTVPCSNHELSSHTGQNILCVPGSVVRAGRRVTNGTQSMPAFIGCTLGGEPGQGQRGSQRGQGGRGAEWREEAVNSVGVEIFVPFPRHYTPSV